MLSDVSHDNHLELSVQIGTSTLTFQQMEQMAGRYHYALVLPQNQYSQAIAWLKQRVDILASDDGRTRFHLADWNAQAVYFRDGDGNIAELIARHNLPTERMMPFTAESIIRISEIGLATPNVIDTVDAITSQTGLRVWRGAGSETFTAVGSEYGLLIVVQQGRNWLPSHGDHAVSAVPLMTHITMRGIEPLQMPDLPYTFAATSPELT